MRDLSRRAFSGFLWAGAADAAGKALVFVATIVLARLLVPSEFGLVAFALSVIYFLEYAGDLGLGAALVYRSDADDPRVSSTAFWIGIVGSSVLFAAAWFVAPLLARVGPGDEVVPLFRVLALQFPFGAIGKAHEYRLRRTLQFRTLFGPTLAGGLTKGVVSIALAVAGAGAWSLVIGQVAGTLAQSVGMWLVHPFRPQPVISREHLPSMMRFGLGIVAVGLLGQGAKNFDYLVVGGKLGAAALGVYYLAFRLPELVILTGFRVANEVLFPFYARLRGDGPAGIDDELRRGYLQTIRLGAMVAWPAAFGIAALALPLVLTLFGEKWRAAAAPMAFVAIWAGLASLASMPGAVFKALGRSWLLTWTGVMQIAILFPAIWFAAPHGITAVAASQVAEKTVSLALLGVIIGRVLGIRWYATFLAAAPALALSAVTGGVLYGVAAVLPPAAALAVGIPLGVVLYLSLLRWLAPDGFELLVRPVLDLRHRMAATAGLALLVAALLLVGCGGSEDSRERAASDAAPRGGRTPHLLRGPRRLRRRAGQPPASVQDHRPCAQAPAVRPAPVRARWDLPGAREGQRHAGPEARAGAREELPRRAAGSERPALDRQPQLLDHPRPQRRVGRRATRTRHWCASSAARAGGSQGSEIWGAHSTSGLQIDDGPRNNLGRWVVNRNCIHDTFATNGPNQDHNVYVADMSASPSPHGVIAHNILFNAENGRGIKLGPGRRHRGREERRGPLQHDLQQLPEREPVARHLRGADRAQHPGEGPRVEHHRIQAARRRQRRAEEHR